MRFTRPAAALGTAVLLAAGLAACGSSNEAGPTAVPLSVTPTPSAPEIPVPTAVPTIVSGPPAMSRTQKSADDFAIYVAKVQWQAQMERSMDTFNALLAPGAACPGCKELQDAIAGLTKSHYFITLDGPLEVRPPVPTSAKGDDYVVGVAYGYPAGKILDDQGHFLHRLAPQPDLYTTVSMTWDASASTWRLTDIKDQAVNAKGGSS